MAHKRKKVKKEILLVGNWKMNPQTLFDAKKLFQGIEKRTDKTPNVSVIIAPPFIYLGNLISKKHIVLGSQDMFYEEKGSFTGSISASMILDAGATFTILGHSERRKQGETNEIVNKKVKMALESDLTPIVCIGEEIRNDDGHHLDFLRSQIAESLAGVSKKELEKVVIAYEPVWAIGASSAMSAHEVLETNLFIKKVIRELWKGVSVDAVRLLYGGSVDETNAGQIVKEGQVDGLLVGRQSLSPESFGSIAHTLNDL